MKKIMLLGSMVILATGCTQTKFSSKSEALSKSVFSGDQASGVISQPNGNNNGASGTVTQPPGGGLASGNLTQGTASGIPLQFVCSYSEASISVGTSASTASALEMIVKDSSGAVVCNKIAGVKDSIAQTKVLDLSSCALSGNSYEVQVVDAAKKDASLIMAADPSRNDYWPADHLHITRDSSSSPWSASVALSSLTDLNPVGVGGGVAGILWASNPAYDHSVDGSRCNVTASPLVVNMTPKGEADPGLMLSIQDLGVWFDILGLNSFPRPYAKKQISWIQNPNYMFLALPRAGQVQGIDELFGNNTYGPDYTFAENGFAALAKYDANHDGVIDARDPIFSSLRLWSDSNFNGKAEPEELRGLEELGIKSIDLAYDPNFFEQDEYGNQSRMRSTVETVTGQLHMIFDLWFALK